MSGDKPLSRKAATLSGQGRFQGRALRLAEGGRPETLSCLLQAVDDTMLPRDLVFALGASRVVLRVSGKRVQAVVSASDDLAVAEGLVGVALTPEAGELLAELQDLLVELAARAGVLTVERREIATAIAGLGRGVAVRTLGAAWDVDLDMAKPGPMPRFLELIAPLASAVMEIEGGEVTNVRGAPDDLAALQQVVSASLRGLQSAHAPFLKEAGKVHLRLLDGVAQRAGELFCVASAGRNACVALVPEGAATEVAAAWDLALV